MDKYVEIISSSFSGYFNYLLEEITNPPSEFSPDSLHNYFYLLVIVSAMVWVLEIVFPWRKEQSSIRKDFWLDGFYMFFNFFLFSLVGYNALSNVGVNLFNDFLGLFSIENIVMIKLQNLPTLLQLVLMFIIADFIQWNIHRLLHRVPWLWEFHKLHHSVEEMGFAAHLRFHWMETIVYKSFQYIPLAMLGFGIQDFFIIHVLAILIGHLNHANLGWDYGPFKYLINNPKMHIWHHARELPAEYKYGVNYGISLSIWDYIAGSAYVPYNGRDIKLGFSDMKNYPKKLARQLLYFPTSDPK